MKTLLSILILLFAVSCVSAPKNPPTESWTATVRILPIHIKSSEKESKWSDELITNGISHANEFWADTGIQFEALPTMVVIDDDIFDQDLLDFDLIRKRSKILSAALDAYPIHFVNSITHNGKIWGGVSSLANMPLGYNFGTSISSSNRFAHSTVGHELGHAWNLRHTWEDKHEDTPGEDSNDCSSKIKCNLMSYCHPKTSCTSSVLMSSEQIAEVRLWSLSEDRINLIKTSQQFSSFRRRDFPRQTNTDPVVDP